MLYTLSKAQYDKQELTTLLAQLQPTDALLLWQDGVLQAVKNRKISLLFLKNQRIIFSINHEFQQVISLQLLALVLFLALMQGLS